MYIYVSRQEILNQSHYRAFTLPSISIFPVTSEKDKMEEWYISEENYEWELYIMYILEVWATPQLNSYVEESFLMVANLRLLNCPCHL